MPAVLEYELSGHARLSEYELSGHARLRTSRISGHPSMHIYERVKFNKNFRVFNFEFKYFENGLLDLNNFFFVLKIILLALKWCFSFFSI
jgi:hypothetical protein